MNIENGIFINPTFEAPPPAFITDVEAGSKKRRTPADRDKARRFNEGRKSQISNDTRISQRRESALNLGLLKRSQRRSDRPY
jgi:hypothetical protein